MWCVCACVSVCVLTSSVDALHAIYTERPAAYERSLKPQDLEKFFATAEKVRSKGEKKFPTLEKRGYVHGAQK